MKPDMIIEIIREILKNNGNKKKNTNCYKVCDTQFLELHPNIEIEIIHNNGKQITK